MKEFIFTWSIKNISFSWHKNQKQITSPSFVAETMQNTIWNLALYPRGNVPDGYDFLSLYLIRRKDDDPSDFSFNCEFSCISADNLMLHSVRPQRLESSYLMGSLQFLRRYEVFVRRKALYLPDDTLTLRCRMWRREGDIDQFGQCFGHTRLEIEKVLFFRNMNPRKTKKKKIYIYCKKRKELAISVGIDHEKDIIDFNLIRNKEELIKFFTLKFCVLLKNRVLIDYSSSYFDTPSSTRIKMPFSILENETMAGNKLKLTLELICSTGEVTNIMQKFPPCSFKFPEFTSKCILSFIPSGKLSDCPSICKDLWNLYSKQILCDVELKTQTASFWVHKTVLCARSPVFLVMFSIDMKEKTTRCVEIEDLENDTLEKFILFLYTDYFKESKWNTVYELYYVSDKYQVERLKFLCSSFLMNKVDDHTVCELLLLADRHSDSQLKSKAGEYIAKHYERIFRSSTWKEFFSKQPALALRTVLSKYSKKGRDVFFKRRTLSSYPNVLEDFRSLAQSQMFSDIAVQAANVMFPAHKTMLGAGSSRLRRLLASKEPPSILKMENLEIDTASRLLLFLYTDYLGDIKWNDAIKLYRAAFEYHIERLKIKCSCFFLEHLKASRVTKLLELAHEHQDVRLESLVKDLISR